MGHVAPLGSDVMNLVVGASCDALDAAMLAFSKSDHLLYASPNIQKFYPVADEYLQPGVSLRDLLNVIFETGVTRGLPGTLAKGHVSANEWVSERIADMWNERGEKTERLGRERWFSVVTRRTASGIGIMLLHDISAFKKKEERWHEDIERVSMTEEILDGLPSPVFVKDRNLAYVAVNKAYCKLHGVSQDTILGRSVWDLVDAGVAEYYEAEERHVLETGEPSLQNEEIITANHQVVNVIRHRFRIGKPGHHYVVTLLEDVSDVVAASRSSGAEDETIELTPQEAHMDADAVDANTNVGEMSAGNRSHDDEGDNGRVLLISSDTDFGNALMSALRGFRLDAFQVDSLAEAVTMLRAASEMGLPVDLILADDEEWPDIAVVENLSDVAVMAFSRARPVHFAVADVASVLARSSTADNGDKKPQFNADISYMPDFPEVGAGHADVGFELEVLVAEDNVVNREVYTQILDGLGVNYLLARDGAEAVRLWEAKRPPLILMDTTLPHVDGLEAARRIRSIEAAGTSRVAIVGVLPRKSQVQIDACLESGMNSTITKPLNVEVIEMLYRHHVLESFAVSQANNAF